MRHRDSGEVECDVTLDLAVAMGLRKWLDDQIKQLQDTIKEVKEQQRQKLNEQKPIASKTG